MKRLIKFAVLLSLAGMLMSSCGGRYAVPDQHDIPNPAIGGRVFGPEKP